MDDTTSEGQSFAYNKFMRARHGDQYAQDWFQGHFRGVLLDRLNRHPGREAACHLYSQEYYVDRTFHLAWDSSRDRPQTEFDTLTAVIQFLLAHLNGLIIDALRTLKMSDESYLPCPAVTQEMRREDRSEAQELWKNMQEILSNERERRLAYLLFHCSLKPVDIMRTFPQEFNDVREISHLRSTILGLVSPSVV